MVDMRLQYNIRKEMTLRETAVHVLFVRYFLGCIIHPGLCSTSYHEDGTASASLDFQSLRVRTDGSHSLQSRWSRSYGLRAPSREGGGRGRGPEANSQHLLLGQLLYVRHSGTGDGVRLSRQRLASRRSQSMLKGNTKVIHEEQRVLIIPIGARSSPRCQGPLYLLSPAACDPASLVMFQPVLRPTSNMCRWDRRGGTREAEPAE